MRFPPRLSHLATLQVLIAKLTPSFAQAHRIDDDEARERLARALPALCDDLLDATWAALRASAKKFDETRTLEKIFAALKDRPLRPGRAREATADLAAFFVLVDVEAGTASDSARRLMETEPGQQRARAGLAEAGRLLAEELTRKV